MWTAVLMQVRSGEILTSQIRLELVIQQWKKKMELKVSKRRQRDGKGTDRRWGKKMNKIHVV